MRNLSLSNTQRFHNHTAGFVEPTDDYPSDFKSFTGETYTGSYTVVLDGDTILGVQNGNCYLGKTQKDVCTATWYETGPAEGISLIVAKNATHHFETWYYIPSLSLFDKEHIEDETECFHNEHSTFIMVQDISEPKISLQRSLITYNTDCFVSCLFKWKRFI